ncbi:hypothetical protein [Chryseobacterium sp. SIMBA_029]|uniref:hypothetical protein n=1 Tax=Chryseobacterium sp. SIMBA_029 TaxID=3085772 RepID=UPI00397E749E
MSGYIELYKIDKKRIKDRLYHELTNHSLPYIYREGINRFLGTFQHFMDTHNNTYDYHYASYEKITEKLRTEDFILEYYEVKVILDWLTWYYESEYETHETFLDDHGLISIGTLNTRYELPIFYSIGYKGLTEFYFPQEKKDPLWNGRNFPMHPEELVLIIDYLLLLCIKIAEITEDPDLDTIHYDCKESELKKNLMLDASTTQHLTSYLEQKQSGIEDPEMEHLMNGGYEYYHYILFTLKQDLGNDQDLIYKNDRY